jgi:hypothetical protein
MILSRKAGWGSESETQCVNLGMSAKKHDRDPVAEAGTIPA